eukprot:TRINITY_DN2892_c0_g1_i2.p1 TRINITY_DN2892_c0_g1~~TRINITY_DN2892_c0_g1_i2.p1  ORF type:complete len:205 (-),score=57.24 TRINITY_DN2892_c0_g1_i2:393-1007(-)
MLTRSSLIRRSGVVCSRLTPSSSLLLLQSSRLSITSTHLSSTTVVSTNSYYPVIQKRGLFGFGEKKKEDPTTVEDGKTSTVPKQATNWDNSYGPVRVGMRVGENKPYTVPTTEVFFSVDPSAIETSFAQKLKEIVPSLSSAADHFFVQSQSPGSLFEKASGAIFGDKSSSSSTNNNDTNKATEEKKVTAFFSWNLIKSSSGSDF